MLDSELAILIAVITAVLFFSAGITSVRRIKLDVEEYLVARNSAGSSLTTATLVASVIGAWILFSPAETGTWAGVVALVGYGIGQAAPLVTFMFVGPRMRRLMPDGHSLTEYVWHRYGPNMYALSMVIILFYMFIFLSAELTGISLAVSLLADIPLWITATLVGALTVAYTAYGGIRASIFTDSIQFSLILPLLLVSFFATVSYIGGFNDALAPVSDTSGQLLSFTHGPGLEFGFTLIIAVFAANMFHQGFWQRVYTSRDDTSLRRGFGIAAIAVLPIILLAGSLGIFAVGREIVGDTPSVALFSLVIDVLPSWAIAVVLVLALTLVMSSLDTLLNGIASSITADLARFKPDIRGLNLLRSSQAVTVILIIPAILIASKGYSVLYLFLIADLICAATVFPVFWGLYSSRFSGSAAFISCILGLAVGVLFFPKSDFSPWLTNIFWAGKFLASFGISLSVSTLASLILTAITHRDEATSGYDFSRLREQVKLIS